MSSHILSITQANWETRSEFSRLRRYIPRLVWAEAIVTEYFSQHEGLEKEAEVLLESVEATLKDIERCRDGDKIATKFKDFDANMKQFLIYTWFSDGDIPLDKFYNLLQEWTANIGDADKDLFSPFFDWGNTGMVTKSQFHQVLSWFGPLEDTITNIKNVARSKWFKNYNSREVIYSLLQYSSPGTFVVRWGKKPGCFKIDLIPSDNKPITKKLNNSPRGGFDLITPSGETRHYSSLEALISDPINELKTPLEADSREFDKLVSIMFRKSKKSSPRTPGNEKKVHSHSSKHAKRAASANSLHSHGKNERKSKTKSKHSKETTKPKKRHSSVFSHSPIKASHSHHRHSAKFLHNS